MSRAAKAVQGMFSGDSGSKAAMAAQRTALEGRERDLAAAEAGQRRARSSDRGFLAFIDDELKKTLGGA